MMYSRMKSWWNVGQSLVLVTESRHSDVEHSFVCGPCGFPSGSYTWEAVRCPHNLAQELFASSSWLRSTLILFDVFEMKRDFVFCGQG